jgi:hypothetical protein
VRAFLGVVVLRGPAFGTVWNVIRFASPRTTKRNHLPVHDYRYPHLES